MRLLSPKENSDAKALNQAQDVLRTQGIQEAAKQARQDLAKANQDFSNTMASFKERWAKEEQTHADRMAEMEKEITALEEKKRIALIPLDLYKNQALGMFEEAQKYLAEAKLQEHNIDQLRELLENKLDDVGDREQKLRAKEERLVLREQGIIAQENLMRSTKV